LKEHRAEQRQAENNSEMSTDERPLRPKVAAHERQQHDRDRHLAPEVQGDRQNILVNGTDDDEMAGPD
jgi:hypothetical protein